MKRILVILTALIGLGFSVNAQAIIDKGTCGDNLTWILTGTDNNLTLTISGTGAMANYDMNKSPWNSHRKNIATLFINNRVTTIGKSAFAYCENLTSISIGNSVTMIMLNAFLDCNSLTSINIPNSVAEIGEHAFGNCRSLNINKHSQFGYENSRLVF
ncbi:MAG: leucine-rich repeat domain-containing protein [Prevotellaceae bacterium]|nr:leucine-rich repeat domain-containing protein [Prevotellaceae bacterium]